MNMQKRIESHINIKNLETGQNKSRKQSENIFKKCVQDSEQTQTTARTVNKTEY